VKEVIGPVGNGDKILRVGRFDYVLDESTGTDIVDIVGKIKQALIDKTVIVVAVLDPNRKPVSLVINGAQVDALAIDLDGPPRPGEISP
jgi:hypothetical protein